MKFKQTNPEGLLYVTEWDKAARPAHERALNQIQKNFQDKISESQNRFNVAKADNQLKTIEKLIQATGTVVKLSQAFDERAKKKEAEKNGEIYESAYKAGVTPEALRTYNEAVDEYGKKNLDLRKLISSKKEGGYGLPEDAAAYLLSMDPYTSITVADRMTAFEAATIPTTYAQSEIGKLAAATEIDDDSSSRMQYIAERFTSLGPSPEIFNKYSESLNDWVATGHFVGQKKIKADNLRKEDLVIGQTYKSNLQAGTPQLNAKLYARNIAEKKASLGDAPDAAQTAKNYEYNRLRDLVVSQGGRAPIISTNELHAILNSKVETEGGVVEIGSKFYMTDEKKNELIRLSEEATSKSLKNSRETRIEILEQQAITLATDPRRLQELGIEGVKAQLLSLKSQIFAADPSHDTSGLDKLLQGNQGLLAYTRLNADVEGALASGNTTHAIKIVNDSGNIQLQGRLEELRTLQNRRKDASLGNADETQESIGKPIFDKINLTLEKGAKLPPQASMILGELEAEYNSVVNPLLLHPDPKVRAGAVQTGKDAAMKLWIDNGGGQDTSTSNGKYAYTPPSPNNPVGQKKGGFFNHAEFNRKASRINTAIYKAVKGTVDLNPTQDIVNSWNTETRDGLDAGGGLGELNVLGRSLAIPENYISANDMVGMIQAKQYSPELIYKAAQLGIAPGTLFESQLNALLKSAKSTSDDPTKQAIYNKHKALVEEFQLDQVKVPDSEVKLWEEMQKIGADIESKQMISLVRQYGLAKISADYPNYLKRAAFIASANDLKTREELYPGGIPLRMKVQDPLYTEEKQRKAIISSGLADKEAGKDNNEQDDEAIQRAIDDPNSNLYK